MPDEKVTFTIDTDEAISVDVFCSSLLAFQKEFLSATRRASTLKVKEIRKGSFEFDLVAVAVVGANVLPFLGNVNTIGQFVEYFRGCVKWLSGQGEAPTEKSYTIDELKNLKEIFAPIVVAQDPQGSIRIVTEGQAEIDVSKNDAKEIVARISNTTPQRIDRPEYVIPDRFQNKVLFLWYQTRFDSKQINTGNQGVVHSIDSKPVRVIFADDSSETKHQMTTTNQAVGRDWQEVGYIVDLELIVTGDRVVAYKILRNYPDDTIYDIGAN